MSASKEATTEGPDFEAALEELEALVERMEGSDLSLDESLAAFERGIHLTRRCQQALSQAEQRVQTLLEREDGSLGTEPLPPVEDEAR
ncbi:MAG: exodeoxyribonuclease VII small subunit [Gammaproteobacteria bacterium]|nr:MAG: exodeoxyribonuclease VII small subunit [Gammaproteobacteria bacterium]